MKRLLQKVSGNRWTEAEIELNNGQLSVCGSYGRIVTEIDGRFHGLDVHKQDQRGVWLTEGCGQCWDEIKAAFPALAALEDWHLNDMKAGLPEQEQAIREWEAAGNKYEYEAVCAMLKTRGLYEIPVPDGIECTGGFPQEVNEGKRGYRYGERWIHSTLPAEIARLAETTNGELESSAPASVA